MEILKDGRKTDDNNIKRFKCKFCECEFNANKKEYKVGNQYNDFYCYCKCHNCKKAVHIKEEWKR